MEQTFHHVSVLANECIENLAIRPDGIYVDATMGGGGHSERILEHLGENGRLIGIDRDRDAIAASTKRLARFGSRFTAVKSNFSDIESAVRSVGVEKIDGVLFDLGVSAHQLDTADRGFSYMNDAPLDMRMDTDGGATAADLVNSIDVRELARILADYGAERFASRILWMDGEVCPGAFQMNTSWYSHVPERDPIFPEHVHDADEVNAFFGMPKKGRR